MALVRCILGKFLGVVCHCFPLFKYTDKKRFFKLNQNGKTGWFPSLCHPVETKSISEIGAGFTHSNSRMIVQITSGTVSLQLINTLQRHDVSILYTVTPMYCTVPMPTHGTIGLNALEQCFSTAGPWPCTGPWYQLYRATRGLRKLQYATRFH